jgi:hypothetical protein
LRNLHTLHYTNLCSIVATLIYSPTNSGIRV